MCIGARPRAGTPDGCGFRAPSQWALDRIDGGEPDPACPDCGGLIKAATVSFGQNLAAATIERAEQLVRAADLVLAVGSSLQVYPAADVPAAGARAGARLAVVNAEPTPLDPLADLAITASAGAVLPTAVGVALTR
jgi:NAD-dependent deacetylase